MKYKFSDYIHDDYISTPLLDLVVDLVDAVGDWRRGLFATEELWNGQQAIVDAYDYLERELNG